jgi:hypothetical protein
MLRLADSAAWGGLRKKRPRLIAALMTSPGLLSASKNPSFPKPLEEVLNVTSGSL